MKQGIYSTEGHSNKQEKEREAGWTGIHKRGGTYIREESIGWKLGYRCINDGIQHDLKLVLVGRKERIYKRAYNRSKIFNSDYVMQRMDEKVNKNKK